MQQQTFIAVLLDKSFNQVGFERFSCKKPETVEKLMKKLFDSPLYRVCSKEAVSIAIYATPDGYNREKDPCKAFYI